MPEVEQPFRLIAEQLPVDLEGQLDSNSIRFLLAYRAALYITPPHAKPLVGVEHFARVAGDGGDTLDMIVANTGKAHTLLGKPVLLVERMDGTSFRLEGADVQAALADRNLHAGGKLKVRLPWPEQEGGEIKGLKLEFTPAI